MVKKILVLFLMPFLICAECEVRALSTINSCLQEAMFEVAVRKDVYEERQNQLRWQVKLGDNQVTPDERIKILDARDFALVEYKVWSLSSAAPSVLFMFGVGSALSVL